MNPDADSRVVGCRWPLGGHVFVAGGGFTDGGRPELQQIDLSAVSMRNPRDISPFTHVDPDADASGGGGAAGVFVAGGGFTDGGRPELQQIDLSGLTPVNPRDGTDAYSGGGDGDGGGPYAPGVAGGDSSAFSVGMDQLSMQVDANVNDNAFQLDAGGLQVSGAAMQLDDFSAQTDGLDSPDDPGIIGFGDGDGQPFP